MRMLVATDYLLVLSLLSLLTSVLGDYQGYNNYVYPETYTYTDNTSLASYDHHYHNQPTQRSRRLLDQGLLEMEAGLSFDASIPIADLGTSLYISMPFVFSFPTTAKSGTGRSLEGPSGSQGVRSTLYKGVEKYMGHLTGADGHSCLLRAMCEASSTPLHDEGIIGDAVTFLLTTNYATEEEDERFKKYFAAQAKGQLTGDCTEWHEGCPMSLFKFIDENIL